MKRNRFMSVLFAVALGSSVAMAADNAPAPAGTKLDALIGTWKGEAEMREPGKPPVKTSVDVTCRATAGSSGVSCDARFASPEMNYLESDLFGYDAAAAKVHWFAVTNAGEVHDHVGEWTGDRLTVRYSGRSAGKKLTEDVTLELGGSTLTFSAVTQIAGATTSTMSGSAKRQ